MKFYLTILFSFSICAHILFPQDSPIGGNKNELPNLNKGSLQIETDVELYPNPAVEYLNIQLKNSQLKNVEFEMYNIIGNKLPFELDAVGSNIYKINIKDLHSGYYLIIIKDPITRYNKAFKFRKQ